MSRSRPKRRRFNVYQRLAKRHLRAKRRRPERRRGARVVSCTAHRFSISERSTPAERQVRPSAATAEVASLS